MPVIEVPADLSVEHLLKAVKQLAPADLMRFGREYQEWRATEGREADEAALLALIEANSRLPGAQQQRFEELRRRRQAGRLGSGEESELQALWVQIEKMAVVRLQALADLAQRRGSDVRTVMHELGLDEQPDAL